MSANTFSSPRRSGAAFTGSRHSARWRSRLGTTKQTRDSDVAEILGYDSDISLVLFQHIFDTMRKRCVRFIPEGIGSGLEGGGGEEDGWWYLRILGLSGLTGVTFNFVSAVASLSLGSSCCTTTQVLQAKKVHESEAIHQIPIRFVGHWCWTDSRHKGPIPSIIVLNWSSTWVSKRVCLKTPDILQS